MHVYGEKTYEYNRPSLCRNGSRDDSVLARVSRPDGIKRLFIVFCAPARCFVARTTLPILKTDKLTLILI
jgi:hypothetical protein